MTAENLDALFAPNLMAGLPLSRLDAIAIRPLAGAATPCAAPAASSRFAVLLAAFGLLGGALGQVYGVLVGLRLPLLVGVFVIMVILSISGKALRRLEAFALLARTAPLAAAASDRR